MLNTFGDGHHGRSTLGCIVAPMQHSRDLGCGESTFYARRAMKMIPVTLFLEYLYDVIPVRSIAWHRSSLYSLQHDSYLLKLFTAQQHLRYRELIRRNTLSALYIPEYHES